MLNFFFTTTYHYHYNIIYSYIYIYIYLPAPRNPPDLHSQSTSTRNIRQSPASTPRAQTPRQVEGIRKPMTFAFEAARLRRKKAIRGVRGVGSCVGGEATGLGEL